MESKYSFYISVNGFPIGIRKIIGKLSIVKKSNIDCPVYKLEVTLTLNPCYCEDSEISVLVIPDS